MKVRYCIFHWRSNFSPGVQIFSYIFDQISVNTLKDNIFRNNFSIYKKKKIINFSGKKYDATFQDPKRGRFSSKMLASLTPLDLGARCVFRSDLDQGLGGLRRSFSSLGGQKMSFHRLHHRKRVTTNSLA